MSADEHLFPPQEHTQADMKVPGGGTCNQIDHIIVDSRHATCVKDVRSYRGQNVESDHFPVIAKCCQRLSMQKWKNQEQSTPKWNTSKLWMRKLGLSTRRL